MALNLDAFAPVVEQYMFDTIRITRPAVHPGTLDESTGTYLAPVDADLLIYEGIAWVAALGSPADAMRGREDFQRTQYEIGIPKAGGEHFAPLDHVEVLDSRFDPELIGNTLVVDGEITSTFTVFRRISAWRDTSQSNRA